MTEQMSEPDEKKQTLANIILLQAFLISTAVLILFFMLDLLAPIELLDVVISSVCAFSVWGVVTYYVFVVKFRE